MRIARWEVRDRFGTAVATFRYADRAGAVAHLSQLMSGQRDGAYHIALARVIVY